jgi:hypothetical protein
MGFVLLHMLRDGELGWLDLHRAGRGVAGRRWVVGDGQPAAQIGAV